MIKTIVVDDEWYNMAEVVDLIESTGFMMVVKEYENGIEALKEIDIITPQVAFIDIEMPEIDGISLAEKLLEKDPSIIIVFITAWNQYAVQAFEINALDYIMKPINVDRFNKMVDRIRNKINLNDTNESTCVKIQCFDKFNASINGKKVIWQRTKAEELFAFLLMNHGEYIHKDIILESLWPHYDRFKALPILQTSICKIRNIFSSFKDEIKINYKDSRYGLFLKNVDCDLIKFEDAISNFNINNQETYFAIEEACKYYCKGFLIQQGYIWSMEKNEEIQVRLVTILAEILRVYSSQNNIEKQLTILEQLVILVPYEEETNYELFLILEKLQKYSEIIQKYNWLKNKLEAEYDMEPSKRLEELYTKYKALDV